MTDNRPKAETIVRKADIVFCIDSTGSMSPCFEGVKNNLTMFIEELHSSGNVDFRLKLIAYRDKHDLRDFVESEYLDFTNSVELFKDKLSKIRASGGGGVLESTLDAIYEATQSTWRDDAHKIIVLMTDAGSHPTLHESTFPYPINDVSIVIQELQILNGSILFMVAPDLDIYQQIENAEQDADRKKIFIPIPAHESEPRVADEYQGLVNIDFKDLMELIGKTISQSIRKKN